MKSDKETIYDYATELKLLAFKEELEYTLSLAAGENWSHLHFLTELLGNESVRRRECRRKSRIKSAGFPQMKYLHELVMEDMPKANTHNNNLFIINNQPLMNALLIPSDLYINLLFI